MSRNAYFTTRLSQDPRREVLWRTLSAYFSTRFLRPDDVVLELGAGYCHFINSVAVRRRIAVDLWDEFPSHAAAGVETHVGAADQLDFLDSNSVDLVFASNLFEHLSQDELAATLSAVRRVLRPGGSLLIVQPNFRFAYREYFDDYTHRTVYTDRSLCDFLEVHQFSVESCTPRFLPLTIRSAFPVHPLLIRLYLAMPFRPFAKQMLVHAVAQSADVE
jgi:SAM-dependent methyltransferase